MTFSKMGKTFLSLSLPCTWLTVKYVAGECLRLRPTTVTKRLLASRWWLMILLTLCSSLTKELACSYGSSSIATKDPKVKLLQFILWLCSYRADVNTTVLKNQNKSSFFNATCNNLKMTWTNENLHRETLDTRWDAANYTEHLKFLECLFLL